MSNGTPPYLNSDGFSSSQSYQKMPNEIEDTVRQFLYALPGVDVAPYVGTRLK